MLTTTSAARATSHNKPASRFRDYASADFDRDACPIIARHFFGVEPFRPIAEQKFEDDGAGDDE